MTSRKPIPVRLDPELVARLDAVTALLSKRAAGAELTRSAALRVAIERGLAELEAELGLARAPKTAKKR